MYKFSIIPPILLEFSWLGIRDGNITFQDSLDFDLSEIDNVYAESEEAL